jgi:hypothetical protein
MKTINFSNKILLIRHFTLRKLASFGLSGWGCITAPWQLKRVLTLCGSGLVDTMGMSDLLASVAEDRHSLTNALHRIAALLRFGTKPKGHGWAAAGERKCYACR